VSHLYLFTLEIVPLEADKIYDEPPSHLTLMSRFLSELSPEELATQVRPFFASTVPIHLAFGETIELGPKKVTAHMVNSSEERSLHNDLSVLLNTIDVEYQYPEFIGDNHKAHVTQRTGMSLDAGSKRITSAAYLIEVVNKKRVIRAKFKLGVA